MFVIEQQGKIVARAKTFIEAQGKAVDLCQPSKPTTQFSKAQLAKMKFDIREIE